MIPESPDDTNDLLVRAEQGQDRAREVLLERHRERLKRMVRLRMDCRLVRRIDPSDVVQDTLIVASEHFDKYLRERPVAFYPWLRRLAVQRLIDAQRRHLTSRRRSLRNEAGNLPELAPDASSPLLEWAVDSCSGPLTRVSRDELRRHVRRSIAELAEIDREVLMLRYLEQLSVRDVAQILEISEAAVKGRQLRALERLRNMIDSEYGEGL